MSRSIAIQRIENLIGRQLRPDEQRVVQGITYIKAIVILSQLGYTSLPELLAVHATKYPGFPLSGKIKVLNVLPQPLRLTIDEIEHYKAHLNHKTWIPASLAYSILIAEQHMLENRIMRAYESRATIHLGDIAAGTWHDAFELLKQKGLILRGFHPLYDLKKGIIDFS